MNRNYNNANKKIHSLKKEQELLQESQVENFHRRAANKTNILSADILDFR
jgi:hypothetical protein